MEDEGTLNKKLLKKLRQRGKGSANLIIKKKLKENDRKQELENFKQYAGQQRQKYAKD